MSVPPGDPRLATRLRRSLEGEVLFSAFDRGRYSTDASIYEIEPLGVVVPKGTEDVARTLEIAAESGVSVVPRGAGTSQAGQAIGPGIVIDTSKHLVGVGAVDRQSRTVWVEPGIGLDDLNRRLRPDGLFFPVDVATASRATLGGMTANNSSGARSLRYGIMVDNVVGMEGILADGTPVAFGQPKPDSDGSLAPQVGASRRATPVADLISRVAELHIREADELSRRIPPVLRHVAGYNLHRLDEGTPDLTPLLVGSEGTLAFITAVGLQLQEPPSGTVLGVCGFPDLISALDAVQHVVGLDPTAVELVGSTLLGLARSHPLYQETVRRMVPPEAEVLLVVELTPEDAAHGDRALSELEELLAERGLPGSVRRAQSAAEKSAVWDVRRAALNIVMTMPGPARPVSFVEDCAIPLEHLAEYGRRVTRIFEAHGTRGTWYAHASVGCLHVRPALDLGTEVGRRALRSIAEQVHDVVRELGGSHSGEHGDGIVRSEFIEPMLGARLAATFREIKTIFDPEGRLNPGRIVDPPRMDDPHLLRAARPTAPLPVVLALDWSAEGGLEQAAGRCNNNGACRRREPGVMCPSFRVTGDEEHVTRGRANALRLAMAGRLGEDALGTEELYHALELCVGCKACRRECPMGIDVARMKVEALHQYHLLRPRRLRDRLVASLPTWARYAARMPGLATLGSRTGPLIGFSERRRLPAWHRRPFRDTEIAGSSKRSPRADVVDGSDPLPAILFVDTFTRWFEPENARAALRVLEAAGYEATATSASASPTRPLCCGRTYLNAGMIDEARSEALRLLQALGDGDTPVVGLEPSCLLTLRDELTVLFPAGSRDAERARALSRRALLLTELLERDEPRLAIAPWDVSVLVHGHCHQKAFGLEGGVLRALRSIPGATVAAVASGCCGMAGTFGYEREHYDLSMAMGELELLPAVRAAPSGTRLVADGTSCRAQIEHGTGRTAVHTVRILAEALDR